jgi:hypothetical protein
MSGGCKKEPVWPQIKGLTPQTAVDRLAIECAKRDRVEGLLNAKLKGFKGLWANANIDVAAERPAQLHLAVRSFFDQPVQVMVTDGDMLSIYDASSSGGPRFYQGLLEGHGFDTLLPVPLNSGDIVSMLLGCAAIDQLPSDLQIDKWKGTYSITVMEPSGHQKMVTARLRDDVLLEAKIVDAQGKLLLRTLFEDHQLVQGVVFAHGWTITASTSRGGESFAIQGRDLQFNGPPLAPETFQFPPPTGFEILPLPKGGYSSPP